MIFSKNNSARPYIKWAGGKSQIISEIVCVLPKDKNERFVYIEPFVGGGAMLFRMLEYYPNIEKAVINDINSDLTNTYKSIKQNVSELTEILKKWETEYHRFEEISDEKKQYYYQKRNLFNSRKSDRLTQSALFIFLNKTCFNGLYRVNRKNLFNVPIGSYKRPLICDSDNLQAVRKLLQKVEILNGDYTQTLRCAGENSLFYFDPPYRPLSNTSSFNSYAKDRFDDNEQIRLKYFCDKVNGLGHQWILSNSDPKTADINDNFFDDLYADYHISRVKARRSIN
jgi:DNA adenine methylase